MVLAKRFAIARRVENGCTLDPLVFLFYLDNLFALIRSELSIQLNTSLTWILFDYRIVLSVNTTVLFFSLSPLSIIIVLSLLIIFKLIIRFLIEIFRIDLGLDET